MGVLRSAVEPYPLPRMSGALKERQFRTSSLLEAFVTRRTHGHQVPKLIAFTGILVGTCRNPVMNVQSTPEDLLSHPTDLAAKAVPLTRPVRLQ